MSRRTSRKIKMTVKNSIDVTSLNEFLAPLPEKDRYRSGEAACGPRLAGFDANLCEINPVIPGAVPLFAFVFITATRCVVPVATDGEGWIPFSWKEVPLPGWCRGNWGCGSDLHGFETARLILQPHRHDLYVPPKYSRVRQILEAYAQDLGLDIT